MDDLLVRGVENIIPSKEEISKYTLNKVPHIAKTTLGEDIGLLGAFYSAKSYF